ncbi:MAG: putative protein-disulfide isomerase [Planctomycetota bacterium]|jgi:putative protein-disulfide isomerase
MNKQLFYIADPMCSWCFAFAPLIDRVQQSLAAGVTLRYVLGGLAPDDQQPMSDETKGYIKSAWQSIEARTTTRFNWEYWDVCQPKRSTWPACRAVLAAGDRGPEMFAAIQQAYYLDARDPSNFEVLVEIGAQLGFDPSAFHEAIDSPKASAALTQDFELRDKLGARSFPSLGVGQNGQLKLLTSGWIEEAQLLSTLEREGLLTE